MKIKPIGLICGAILLLSFITSGCTPSPEAARKELAALGVEYSPVSFLKAAANGDLPVVELFLLAEMDVDVTSETPEANMSAVSGVTALALAVHFDHTDIIRELVEAGAAGDERRRFAGHENSVHSVVFSPDGKRLVSASTDNTVRLWNPTLDDDSDEVLRFNPPENDAKTVTLARDPTRLAFITTDDVVGLLDVSTGDVVQQFEGHTHEVNTIAFSPDGTQLASGGEGPAPRRYAYNTGTAKLWDVATGDEVVRFEGHTREVNSIAFSPDGKLLASGSYGELLLWDVTTGDELRRFDVQGRWVNSVTFSPDGKLLASGIGNLLVLWDVATGDEVVRFEGHLRGANSIAFSPDGKLLASGSLGELLLWDVIKGEQVRRLEGHANWVISVAFSLDGTQLASASTDNTVRLWRVPTQILLRLQSQ